MERNVAEGQQDGDKEAAISLGSDCSVAFEYPDQSSADLPSDAQYIHKWIIVTFRSEMSDTSVSRKVQSKNLG